MRRLAAVALLLTVPGFASAHGPARQSVSVLYAGSLVTPMEEAIKPALRQHGIDFQGEPGGSKKLANLISAGLRDPDAYVSVDPALVTALGSKVSRAVTFAGTLLGIGWSDNSRYAALLAKVAAGRSSLIGALETPGLVIGRTDPRLDPKGAYTIEGVTLLAGAKREKQMLGADENDAQIFPEEDLLTRVDTGDADVGFFYQTEAIARGLHFVALPGAASLSGKITYTLAMMKDAPHPVAARAFERFVLDGPGRTILERSGIIYFKHPRTVVP